MSLKLLLPLAFIALVTSSCLQTDDIELEKRLVFRYTFEGMNNVYTSDTDTLQIQNIRLYVSRMWFVTTSEDSLNTTDPYIFRYTSGNLGEAREVFAARLGFSGYEDFDDYKIRIRKFSNRSGLNDDILLNQGDTLSYIIRGEINGEEFSFKSADEFEASIPFNEVNLTDSEETITITLVGNAQEWLTAEILDPRDIQNKQDIEANFRNSFRIEAERSSQIITE